MKNSVFREKSLERMQSPEQMDKYIKVIGPSVWLALGGFLVLLAGLVIWSFSATLTTELSLKGVALNGHAVCYVAPEVAETLAVGMRADASGVKGEIIQIGDNPISRQEVSEDIGGGYAFDSLDVPQWSVPVVLSMPEISDGIVTLSVVTAAIHPAEFVLN